MTFETVFFVLSILGIADAGYLTYKHTRKQPLVCPIGDSCSLVTESRWSHLFGVRTEVLGLLYYLSLLFGILGILLIPAVREQLLGLLLWVTGFGVLFSIFLVSLQAFVIKNYCFYCMISALLSLLLFFDSVVLFIA